MSRRGGSEVQVHRGRRGYEDQRPSGSYQAAGRRRPIGHIRVPEHFVPGHVGISDYDRFRGRILPGRGHGQLMDLYLDNSDTDPTDYDRSTTPPMLATPPPSPPYQYFGSYRPMTDAEALRYCTVDTYAATDKESDGEPAKSCSICLEDYVDGVSRGRLACKHDFHSSCLREWLKTSATCPQCRFHVRSRPNN